MNEMRPSQEVGDPGEEEVLDQIVDLEEYAKAGKRPPLAKGYRFRVNGQPFVIHQPIVTGLDVLTVAGLLPAKDYTLRLKMAGAKPEKIGLEDKVDLRRHGIEKFKALPRDQTEG
ncbi:multiubiquitin domain-containing protein [Rhodopseudomonas sp.]|uniref:multiubiquitin domain-containing protein n=1 Tax=Rhodopseudomonas sp. TaxID=1078 RepID=UPI0039E4A9CB